MAKTVAESREGVTLLNLNWGYQIVRGSYVLASYADAVLGPERTPHCTQRARAAYEKLADVYKRLYAGAGEPSVAQLTALAAIVRKESLKHVHLNVLLALHKRGVIDRKWKLIGGSE
jgi:hypothetical protein